MRKIVTHHTYPAIPDRRYDWCAFYEGSFGPLKVEKHLAEAA